MLFRSVDYIPGHYLGQSLDGAVTEIETILKSKQKATVLKVASQEYVAALQGFNAKRAHIESTLKLNIPPLSIGPEEIDASIQHLGNNIAAALQFGDMEHLSEEMEWLKVLLNSYNRPRQEMVAFMEGYSHAIDAHINGQGEPIKKWLRTYALERT